MQIIRTVQDIKQYRHRQALKSVGFVPTMGALHTGHLQLVEKARQQCDTLIVSIFVNPMQFGPSEDFGTYPRPIDRDIALLESARVDALFLPDASELYPSGFSFKVVESPLSEQLCGAFRPGFFTGVLTVVAKLFNLVNPTDAYFGQKDFQQFKLIEKMIAELNFALRLHLVPTVREADGLAMSSRNAYLDAAQRLHAPRLYATLQQIRQRILDGQTNLRQIVTDGEIFLTRDRAFQIQYLEIRRQHDLGELNALAAHEQHLIVLVAAVLGTTRLIDNLLIERV